MFLSQLCFVLGALLTYLIIFLQQSCKVGTVSFTSIVLRGKLAQRSAVTYPIQPCLGGSRTHSFHHSTVFQDLKGPPESPRPVPPAFDVCPLYNIFYQWSLGLCLHTSRNRELTSTQCSPFHCSGSTNEEGSLIPHLDQGRT